MYETEIEINYFPGFEIDKKISSTGFPKWFI